MDESLSRRVVGGVAFYSFAILNFFLYLGIAVISGSFFTRDTEKDKLQYAIQRDRFWNLNKSPIPGFNHHFQHLRNGKKLHYISNKPLTQQFGPLFVFIHGFPDSVVMWRHLLQEPEIPMQDAALICVDLPGFGGSDSLEKYDTEVLESVAEFIVAMRDIFLEVDGNGSSNANTIVVGHDWGCVVAMRLASEAPTLADRFILINGPHVELGFANKDRVLLSATKIFRQFRQSPRKNFGCLSKSIHVLKPLFTQVMLFAYIFTFHLPPLMVRYLGTGGNFSLLRGSNKMEYGENLDEYRVQESKAVCFGPGAEECKTSTSSLPGQNGASESYGESVAFRAKSAGDAFWHMTSYYRDGLARDPWSKSLETIADLYALENEASDSPSPLRRRSSSSTGSVLFAEKYKGVLHAPSTILWGEKDIALSKQICLDGIGDYITRDSEVVLLPQAGHWPPVEKESRKAVAHLIKLYAEKDVPNMLSVTKHINEVYDGAVMLVKK